MALPAQGSVTDSRLGRIRGSRRSSANSASEGKDSGMTVKGKRNVTLEHDASPIPPHAEDTSRNHAPSQEEIRRRAYEIYLERDGLAGNEIDDWHRAEREVQKVALFTQDWNRIQERLAPTPKVETDNQRNTETIERSKR